MKITKKQLKRIIKEELTAVLTKEGRYNPDSRDPRDQDRGGRPLDEDEMMPGPEFMRSFLEWAGGRDGKGRVDKFKKEIKEQYEKRVQDVEKYEAWWAEFKASGQDPASLQMDRYHPRRPGDAKKGTLKWATNLESVGSRPRPFDKPVKDFVTSMPQELLSDFRVSVSLQGRGLTPDTGEAHGLVTVLKTIAEQAIKEVG